MPRTMPTTRRRRSTRPALLAAALTIGLGLVLSGCSEDADPTGPVGETTSPESTETPSDTGSPEAPAAQVIEITVSGDTVEPNGERVDAAVGEEIVLRVTSDAPGEIHVHSTPEQALSYEAGTTDLPLTIDQPGLVDVESHTLDLVIVQLEVR
ncbi:hypothetical protein CF8_0883 [Nocardioides sp. CF8]|uniref:hypothetical protein n=1 Tax=Nocardioides sp. CF8 TaxID=110319 RepID=UPI00032EAC23|nr:hypothetical protein [Nocardioides sp. CF8]EON24985.1 hypothetical protein CF8_0883 [Nocardioides sp. CF8]